MGIMIQKKLEKNTGVQGCFEKKSGYNSTA